MFDDKIGIGGFTYLILLVIVLEELITDIEFSPAT